MGADEQGPEGSLTMGGQVLQQQVFESASGRIDMNVSTNATGVYVVQVTDGSLINALSPIRQILRSSKNCGLAA